MIFKLAFAPRKRVAWAIDCGFRLQFEIHLALALNKKMATYPKNQLVPSIASESVAELMVSLADTAVDAAISSGALDGIPVVGLATGAMRAARDVRQAFLVRKLVRFLSETASLTDQERLDFKSKFHDEEQAEEFGGLVVVLLDRADDLSKPIVLGRLLVAYAKGAFSQDDFFRLARMVERSFTDDLYLLRGFSSGNMPRKEIQAQNLSSIGFLYQAGFDGGDLGDPDSGGILYQISQYGEWVVRYGLEG
ncbi:hypothetical protein ASD22_02825 [Rhodanobacter sp. Root480]|uniref:hypothetical protein n=1 Tax=Rhodanobacter sp. Root480 TaxID=1736542 RepID=UPI0007014633|nr:hypothetical protein [Rhodanobacter sp. Root480]KQX99226.1 hypothetical protein ASD22_02825 [Rhodanobacter sp. Root480]